MEWSHVRSASSARWCDEIGGYEQYEDEDEEVFRATPEGPAALADGLKANSTVQQLHAQNNRLGPEGAKSFRKMLEDNSTLTLLDVSGNNMGAKGAAALADGLKANSTVKELDASRNKLGPKGGKAVAEALKTNQTLCTIVLSGKDKNITIHADQLRQNTVDALDYSGQGLHVDGGTFIVAELLKSNTSVTKVSNYSVVSIYSDLFLTVFPLPCPPAFPW